MIKTKSICLLSILFAFYTMVGSVYATTTYLEQIYNDPSCPVEIYENGQDYWGESYLETSSGAWIFNDRGQDYYTWQEQTDSGADIILWADMSGDTSMSSDPNIYAWAGGPNEAEYTLWITSDNNFAPIPVLITVGPYFESGGLESEIGLYDGNGNTIFFWQYWDGYTETIIMLNPDEEYSIYARLGGWFEKFGPDVFDERNLVYFEMSASEVPLPSTFLFLASGLVGFELVRRKFFLRNFMTN